MFRFIPSWYGKENSWVRDAKVWYRTGTRMEFDDAVNQIKMFRMAGEDVEIILLSCMPDLRYFLHRERIDEVSVWSAFDIIQNIRRNEARPIRLNEYSWPEDLEWFYTPFLMLGYIKGELYAKAEFSEEGWWAEAEFYEKRVPVSRIHLDDRGFVSYEEHYEGGEPAWRLYYDREGTWQIKEDLRRRNVYVNPLVGGRFDRTSYENLGKLIEEVLGKYFKENIGAGEEEYDKRSAAQGTDADRSVMKDPVMKDSLIIAYDEQHNEIAREIIRRKVKERKIAYSLFSQRNGKTVPSMIERLIRENHLLVTDTEYLAEEIKRLFPQFSENVMDLSPYDARLALGKSNTIRALKILLYFDTAAFDSCASELRSILRYMAKDRKVYLTVGIGRHVEDALAVETAKVRLMESMASVGVYYRFEGEKENIAENEVEEEEEPRICVRECRSETQIIEVLSDHRIVIDLSSTPDLYLQIAGISAGLPIILRAESQYVHHKENGWILKNDEDPDEALRYYLSGLSNWNRALIWSLRRIGEYTNGKIVEKWKKVMECPSGKDSGTSDK